MITVGLDYSMTSPAVCVAELHTDTLFKDCHFFCFGKRKQIELAEDFPNITMFEVMDFDSPEQRYDQLANWTMNCIPLRNTEVYLEGYSFGSSSGLVFQIAENTGLLKHKLMRKGLVANVIPPTSLKKHVTGKGNAKKEMMYDTFLKETGIPLQEELTVKKATKTGNPVSDIIDSYYLMKYGKEITLQLQTSSKK